MGTKLAPSFANLFMGHLEEQFVYTYHLKPFISKRFIDDIFFVWTYGPKELDEVFWVSTVCEVRAKHVAKRQKVLLF